MSRQSDTLTVALTGQLTFILVLSAFLALIASYLILRLYRRAVIKSMRRRSRSAILEPKGFLPPEPEHKPNDASLTFTFVTRNIAQANRDAATLYRSANRRRWVVAFVHIIAGCCFAAAMTIGIFDSGKNGLLAVSVSCLSPGPMRGPSSSRLTLSSDFLAAANSSRALLYFLIGSVIGAILLVKNPGLPAGQLLILWLDFNAIPDSFTADLS